MALINCIECNHSISDTARSCPQCGAEKTPSTQRTTNSLSWRLTKFILGLVGIFILAMTIDYATTPEYKREASRLRSACEKIFPFRKDSCDQIYNDTIRTATESQRGLVAAPAFDKEKAEWEAKKQEEEKLYIKNCIDNKKEITSEYQKLVEKREWHKAGLKVGRCAELTSDAKYRELAMRAQRNTK